MGHGYVTLPQTSYASSIESELESKREATEALKAEMYCRVPRPSPSHGHAQSNKKKFEEQCEEYESQLKASHQETQVWPLPSLLPFTSILPLPLG